MSMRLTGTTGGVVLIGLGLLLVAIALGERPDRINLGPHRFYSEADRDEFQAANEHVYNLKKGLGGAQESGAENNLASEAQSGSEIDAQVQPAANGRADALAAAEADFAALKQKQVSAFRNQDTLSLTLKSLGIACLAVGAIFLMRVSRAKRRAQNVGRLVSTESASQ